jgi:hypothetical protein
MDPDADLGGPKTYESYGSGSGCGYATLHLTLIAQTANVPLSFNPENKESNIYSAPYFHLQNQKKPSKNFLMVYDLKYSFLSRKRQISFFYEYYGKSYVA